MMKRAGIWIGLSLVVYLSAAILLSISLINEFGSGSFGPDQAYAGIFDYAQLYPHIVLYPLFWSIFAFVSLGLAFSAIDGHGDVRQNSKLWRISLVGPLVLYTVIAVYVAYLDAKNPAMMLFEIAPSSQQKLVAEYIKYQSPTDQNTTVASIVFDGISEADDKTAKKIRNELFDWKQTWKRYPSGLSESRPFYVLSVAGIIWAMFATLHCAAFAALMPEKSIAKRRTVYASIGAATGLLLWFPHRIYYNAVVKSKLFDAEDNPGIFDVWLPAGLEEKGLTATDIIPVFFTLLFLFITVIVVLKKDPQDLIKKLLGLLSLIGLNVATLWGAISPQSFGRAIGLSDGNWDRLVLFTIILLVLFLIYCLFIFHHPDEVITDANAG